MCEALFVTVRFRTIILAFAWVSKICIFDGHGMDGSQYKKYDHITLFRYKCSFAHGKCDFRKDALLCLV